MTRSRTPIKTEPQRFITRNGGFVIAAGAIEVDDNAKLIRLQEPSLITGVQPQAKSGVGCSSYTGEEGHDPAEPVPFYVRAEIVVDPDPDEVVETAIARNTATPVKSISQAGARAT